MVSHSDSPREAEAPAPALASQQDVIDRHQSRQRLLLVDDNEDAVVMLARLLVHHGHDARACTSGADALAMGADFEPDTVILDLGMPGMDGFETAARLKQQPWGNSVFLIALTGWGRDDDVHRTRSAGFDQHLVKPLEIDRLIDLLAKRPRGRGEVPR
jgi:CheY-like chemotaxis protein